MSIEAIVEAMKSYGALGVLVSALVSNLIPGFPALYLTLVFSYAAVNKGDLAGLTLLILAGGVGAALGKFIEFYLSDVLSSRVRRIERKRRALRALLAKTGWGMAFLVFLFAALPLPDDVLYIPLGAAGYSKLAFIVGVTLGKIVLTAITALLGAFVGWLVTENILLSIIVISLGTAILLALMFAVDWEAVLKGYEEGGWKAAVKALAGEISRLLRLQRIGGGERDSGRRPRGG